MNRRIGKVLVAITLGLAALLVVMGVLGAAETDGVIYVDADALGKNNGDSWEHAFIEVQLALSVAQAGDEIWVAAGVYYPDYDPGSEDYTGWVTATFALTDGVELLGGFDPTYGAIDKRGRDPATYVTVLSGDLDGNDTNVNGVVTTTEAIAGYNAWTVVTASGVTDTAVLDGFVITAGNADGIYPDDCDWWEPCQYGGGMYNHESSPTLIDVIFSGNAAEGAGGGMANYEYSSPTLSDVTFSGNSSAGSGGGMLNREYSSPTLINVLFSGNEVVYGGGGMYNYRFCSPTLADVTFTGNSAERGGGMRSYVSCNPTLTDVTFSDNSAVLYGGGMNIRTSQPSLVGVTFSGNEAWEGGGMYNDSSSPTLVDVTFSGNSAYYGGGLRNYDDSDPTLTDVTFNGNSADRGGGMYESGSSDPTLTDVTFAGNSATDNGGGMYSAYGSPTLINVVFSGNEAAFDGGAMYNAESNSTSGSPTLINVTFGGNSAGSQGGAIYNVVVITPTLTNCILWANDATEDGDQIYDEGSEMVVSYSDVEDGWDGDGNIEQDPLFVDEGGGDLRLQPDSPAIDAGDNEALPPEVITDLDGNPRLVDVLSVEDTGNGTAPIVDMGAYEVQFSVIYLPLVLRAQ